MSRKGFSKDLKRVDARAFNLDGVVAELEIESLVVSELAVEQLRFAVFSGDIQANGGTLDSVVVGGNNPAAGTFTVLTATSNLVVTGASISGLNHSSTIGSGSNTHADIDNHISNTSNPHNVTSIQVGRAIAQWNADELQSTSISPVAPVNQEVLVYNSTFSRWTPSTNSAQELQGHTINTLAPSDDYTLVFSAGGEWVPTSPESVSLGALPFTEVTPLSNTLVKGVPSGGGTDIGITLAVKGTGAFTLDVPDGAATGGNDRGINSIDLQVGRSAAAEVVSGDNSGILSGTGGTVAGNTSAILGGTSNTITAGAVSSFIVGASGTITGATHSIIAGGLSASINHDGVFVHADSTALGVSASDSNSTVFQNGGGFVVYTDSDTSTQTGVMLGPSDTTWTTLAGDFIAADAVQIRGQGVSVLAPSDNFTLIYSAGGEWVPTAPEVAAAGAISFTEVTPIGNTLVKGVPTGGTTDIGITLAIKGTGAFTLDVPDGAATGGNDRGSGAIDLQTNRNFATDVAAGFRSAILSGYNHRNDGSVSTIIGGTGNTISGGNAGIIISSTSSLSGDYSMVVGGKVGSATGDGIFVKPDGTDLAVSSSVENQTVFQTGGGMIIYTDSDTSTLTGVKLGPSDIAWTTLAGDPMTANAVQIQGQAVSVLAPSDDYALSYVGGEWVPTAPSAAITVPWADWAGGATVDNAITSNVHQDGTQYQSTNKKVTLSLYMDVSADAAAESTGTIRVNPLPVALNGSDVLFSAGIFMEDVTLGKYTLGRFEVESSDNMSLVVRAPFVQSDTYVVTGTLIYRSV